MSNEHAGEWCYFLSYTGVRLPLKMVTPLEEEQTRNRNTYFSARFDDQERLVTCRKIVYGEMEFEHRYSYHDNGNLARAEISDEEEGTRVLEFDAEGAPRA